MRRWDGLVEKHAAELTARGLAKTTIDTRIRELDRFGGWLKRRRPKPQLEQVDAELVVRYVRGRTHFHSRAAVASVVSNLRCMGEVLAQQGIWRTNPLRWMRGPKIDPRRHLPRPIRREHLAALWDAAHGRPQEYARYQAVAMLAILHGTGLRRGELERLSLCDWDRDHALLRVDGRKTNRPRQVPVGEGVWRCIEAYLPHRHNRLEATGHVEEQALLVNRRGKRLTGQNVTSLIRRLCVTAGVPPVTAHQFRHSCASDLLEAGVPLPEVQKILGHAAIESTVRYADVADPERALAMSKHPVNRFLSGDRPQGEAS